jgi:hypothetical protein
MKLVLGFLLEKVVAHQVTTEHQICVDLGRSQVHIVVVDL